MIKRMIVLILLTIWLSLSPAYAGAGIPVKGYGYSSGAVTGTAQVVKTSPGLIYGVTLVAGSSTSTATIYDAGPSGASLTTSNAVWQLEASAANSSVVMSFGDAPLATSYGIEVSTANQGVVYLNYQ